MSVLEKRREQEQEHENAEEKKEQKEYAGACESTHLY
jgi:hypothetical protein